MKRVGGFEGHSRSFHCTYERSHWIKDNLSNPNLNNSIMLKNANSSVIVTFIVEMTNGIFRSQSRALLALPGFWGKRRRMQLMLDPFFPRGA